MSAWTQASSHAIKRDKLTIAVCYVDGCTLFTLWNGDDIDGVHECPHACMERTAELAGKSANGQWALAWLQGRERREP